jgi:hypothetical protein
MYLNQIERRLRGVVEVDEIYVAAGLKGKRGLRTLQGQVLG